MKLFVHLDRAELNDLVDEALDAAAIGSIPFQVEYYKFIRSAVLQVEFRAGLFFSGLPSSCAFPYQGSFCAYGCFGCNLDQLVVLDEFEALFQAEDAWRDQLERFVGPSCTGVGDMLFLAYIHYNIFTLRADADDHAFIDFQAGADKHTATVLRLPKAIAGGLPASCAIKDPCWRLCKSPL